jgi:transglutaminase-like putative cysteine protease
VIDETFAVELDGVAAGAPTELLTDFGGRSHVITSGPGSLSIRYSASIEPAGQAAPSAPSTIDEATIVGLRQSRYCQSDVLAGFASVELGHLTEHPDRAAEIAAWVHRRLVYELGSSGPLDTAVDTLLMGAGVCRDFAHLTIALCRALGVPARLAAVYAPGLSPMDFHAVVEAKVGDVWNVLDPTRLAPRQSLVRIATGRDAADTAFATTLAGEVELTRAEVTAVVDGDLPIDDHSGSMQLR